MVQGYLVKQYCGYFCGGDFWVNQHLPLWTTIRSSLCNVGGPYYGTPPTLQISIAAIAYAANLGLTKSPQPCE